MRPDKPDLIGPYVARTPSFFRRLTKASFGDLPSGHLMTALVEFDVTDARRRVMALRRDGARASLFALVLQAIAIALSEYRELNAVWGRGRVFEFDEVDINLPVETDSEGEKIPRQVVIRNAASKSIERIHAEVEAAREQCRDTDSTGSEDRWAMGLMKGLLRLPAFVRRFVLRRLTSNPLAVKRASGTTFVTSVGSYGLPGFAIPFLAGSRAVSFALGGVTRKPVIVGEAVEPRDLLSLTILFNHDIVDGAPASRFVKRLKRIIERGG